MEIEVREVYDEDLDSINSLLKDAFSVTKSNFSSDDIHEIVAVVDSKIVGYLLYTKVFNPIKSRYYGLIDYVCVASKYRRMGVARKMLEYVTILAMKDDLMYLQLTCSYFRIAAHHLYENCGFVKRESDIYRKEII